MSEGHQQPTPDQVYLSAAQKVTLADFTAEGFILDIGGGGEGIIGQLKGAQVVAIDPIRRELVESPAGPLKIVMDGSELKFLDATLQNVTAFFSFYVHVTEIARKGDWRSLSRAGPRRSFQGVGRGRAAQRGAY